MPNAVAVFDVSLMEQCESIDELLLLVFDGLIGILVLYIYNSAFLFLFLSSSVRARNCDAVGAAFEDE